MQNCGAAARTGLINGFFWATKARSREEKEILKIVFNHEGREGHEGKKKVERKDWIPAPACAGGDPARE